MSLMVAAMKLRVGNPLRKLVLIKLADNASDMGECWPSYQHIADQCEISKRSVMNHIAVLCESGLLRKEIRKGGPKGNSSNVYFLTLDGGAAPAPGLVQELHPEPVTILNQSMNRSLNQLCPRLAPRPRRVGSCHSLHSNRAVKSPPICLARKIGPVKPSRPGPATRWLITNDTVLGRSGMPRPVASWVNWLTASAPMSPITSLPTT